ncbi:1-acyl-sn-glycerol-3-phosphate acyltransferase [Rhizobium sp. L1K21]|uniref:lysophospholipid acyltransferase family protein n=1 Tax=Rhizobium sp. L1K21 TaxID=2954933 RepID=UPI0020933DFF|nr:lysophospholipid acyltransferase family protein [Rhizobium sp. L1K21]MCO6188166.1 1-acyl-sn-glycerol-3-phosphate acyltransferase [Rhizobium sp. L1K21]
MILIRSIAFTIAFYLNLIVQMIIFSPIYFIMPRKKAYFVPKFWARSNRWLFDKIGGTTFEIDGLENLTAEPAIISPKHQSTWDTIAFVPYIEDPIYILKRELLWIPLFGWYAAKQRMIPVDRAARGKSMVAVMERAKEEMASGRQLIIYPEGTRRPPGAEPVYKFGIARLYRDLQLPVIPIIHHGGLFWPRRKLINQPGHFRVKILPAIPPGMDHEVFFEHLVELMERESDALLVETIEANPHLKLPPTAAARYKQLKQEA